MEQLLNLKLPLSNPVLILMIILLIVLVAPLLFQKLRMPGIVGLIMCGILIGPNSLNLLSRDIGGVNLFATIGLLYLMFLAGLEINMNDYKKNSTRSLTFGVFTFIIPLVIGFICFYYVFHFGIISSLLIASMFSTHTLLSYPIAARLGITGTEIVTVVIGGTIVTDTAVLLLFTIIVSSTQGDLNFIFWLRLLTSISLFSFIVLWIIPKLSRRFLKHLKSESGAQFVFVLLVVFLSGYLAEVAGIEPIIGAFFAGLALNRLIPKNSVLMNRIVFIGNSLFIPVFLVSVGMLINFKAFFNGTYAIIIAATLIIVAALTKFLAALATQLVFKYSSNERNLLFGLSNSHAAATLAVILVGFNLKLIDENVLNGTILVILFSSLISSFVTEISGRKIAIQNESAKLIDKRDSTERILVPISNPYTIESLVDFSMILRDSDSKEPIYPLSVVQTDDEARNLLLKNTILQRLIANAALREEVIFPVTRVDFNIANGISRAIKEMAISTTVMGWNGKTSTADFIFGSILDNLLALAEQMIIVAHVTCPLNHLKKIIVLVPPNAQLETGFENWLRTIRNLSRFSGGLVKFYAQNETIEKIKSQNFFSKQLGTIQFFDFEDWDDMWNISKQIDENDMLVIVSARKRTLSYNINLENVTKYLSKYHEEHNFAIIFPAQKIVMEEILSSHLESLSASPMEENIKFVNKFGTMVKRFLHNDADH